LNYGGGHRQFIRALGGPMRQK